MTADSTMGGKLPDRYLLVGMAILFVAILVRDCGMYAHVFSDEYTYSMFSRHLPLADSTVPGYIYLATYRATNVCGDGFLFCARILNAIFFVAATPFIYLAARQVCERGVASAVAMLALAGPVNVYTAYYIPESLYFLSFWLLTWYVLRLDNAAGAKAWLVAGVLLGLAALIKPHALLFLPAIVVYVLYVGRRERGPWLLQGFRNAAVVVVFGLFTKLSIGYLFAGKAGVTLFGTCYTSIAHSTASQWERYAELLALSVDNLKGHLLALCLMFGVPIAVAVIAAFRSWFVPAAARPDQKVAFYAFAVLVNLLLVVAAFTASVANSGPYESVVRLHMRYYNFAFPLLFMIAASQLSLPAAAISRGWRGAVALPIALAIVYAILTRLAPYTPSPFDCPELRGFTQQSTIFSILGILSLIALALWVYSAEAGIKMFVRVFMPLSVVLSGVYVNQELRSLLAPDEFGEAGICARQRLPEEERSKVVVVGTDERGLYKTLFYLDNPHATFATIPEGDPCDLTKLPADKEWALVIGDHALPEHAAFETPLNGFTLGRIRGADAIDVGRPGILGIRSSDFHN